MPITGEPPSSELLPGSPLDLVVFQVQHEDRERVAAPLFAHDFLDACGGTDGPFQRFETVEQQDVLFDVGSVSGPQTTKRTVGHRFISDADHWTASVVSGSITLETTRYPGWSDFRSMCKSVLNAAVKDAAPVSQQRVGLRYIDRISEPGMTKASNWGSRICADLIGLARSSKFGDAVVTTRSQTVLDLGQHYQCLVNQAFVPSPNGESLDCVLDFDLYLQVGRRFAVDGVLDTLEVLHSDAKKLFYMSVLPAQMEQFQR